MTKERLGEFEHDVLVTALRLGKDAYSAAIVLELERLTGRAVAPAAVYIALRRLEEDGLAATELKEADGRGGRRERRYVCVTGKGRRMLRQTRARLLRLWDGIEPLLAEE